MHLTHRLGPVLLVIDIREQVGQPGVLLVHIDVTDGQLAIQHELHSGASHYDLYGAFDGSVRREIVTIVDKQEYRKLMDYVHKADPKAFVTVYSVNEIRYQPKK